jgi:thimet oligopeptidase
MLMQNLVIFFLHICTLITHPVMHAVCSRAPCSLLSWAWPIVPWPGGVEQDFLEVPSMMFEQWVYTPEVLARLSSHIDEPEKTLPTDIIEKLISIKVSLI